MTAADEWAIVSRYINPPLPDGRHVIRVGKNATQTAAWVIVDRDGSRVSKDEFGSCIAAMNALEGGRT